MKSHLEQSAPRVRRLFRGVSMLAAGATLIALAACSSGGGTIAPEDDDRSDAEVLEAAQARGWVVATSGDGGVSGGTIVGSSTGKLSFVRAIATLQEEGWTIDPLFMAAANAPVQALVQGRVDLVSAPVPTVLAARAAGADIKAFGAAQKFDFVMVGDSDLDPSDCDDCKIAYQSAISSGTMAALLMMKDSDSEPEYLTIGGTSTRLAALVAGEIDATAVRIGADTEAVEAGTPGEFSVLYEPLKDYPWLLDSVVAYDEGHMDRELQAFSEAFLKAMIQATLDLTADPTLLDEWTEIHELRSVPDVDRLLELLSTDVGLSADIIDQQIALMDELGQLDDVEGEFPTGADFVDLSIWDAIKDDIG